MANCDRGKALTAEVVERVRQAHARWECDCLALDLRLSDAGLSFGATGYKLAVERGLYRLVEGVTLALRFLRDNISPRSPTWSLAHEAILDAVDQQFLASSRLVPTPASDPVLAVASSGVKYQVLRHREHGTRTGWTGRVAAGLKCMTLAIWLRLR